VQPQQAIILAGGRGSRLGPVTAQRSKALVTIGQRPHLVHQLLLLRDAGVVETVVVVSPDTERQVVDVVTRAGFDDVLVVVQSRPRGPVDALRVGLLHQHGITPGTFVLMSDSFVDEPLALQGILGENDWVGVAPAPTARSFCYPKGDDFADGEVEAGQSVTVGINYLASREAALVATETALVNSSSLFNDVEVPMSSFFNAYAWYREGSLTLRELSTWLDVGDVDALARAHRSRFISRSHHKLELGSSGIIIKHGQGEAFERQADWLLERRGSTSPAVANLFPAVYDAYTGPRGSEDSEQFGWYAMEYVDLPTLAELWLYWPGLPSVWQSLLRNVVAQLEQNLWAGPSEDEPTTNVLWFVDKTRDRLNMRGLPEWHAAAEPLLALAEAYLLSAPGTLVRGHGDLNFSNILYSLNTGMIKLIDPRGDHLVPWLYELAKLRYSYHGGFTAITHGLASYNDSDASYVNLWPQRDAEIAALDAVIAEYADLDLLTVCEGCILIAGAPLHEGAEAHMLFWRGIELLHGVFGD
jgi:GTP:adenosylcobinamide-phosphate guanylyltransferase